MRVVVVPSAVLAAVIVLARVPASGAAPAFALADPGTESAVAYEKYGEFRNVGTPQYTYVVTNRPGLAAAVGEGIFPNERSLAADPAYRQAVAGEKLTGSAWKFVESDDPQLEFFKWATEHEAPGVKLFYTAAALQRAGHPLHAIKAYHALVVHYPNAVTWSRPWNTPIYLGPAAIDGINWICRQHPELGLKLVGARIRVESFDDRETSNDIVTTTPGRFVRCKPEEVVAPRIDPATLKVVKETAGKRVKLVKYENGHWQLLVDGKPFVIKGMVYGATKIGQSPDNMDMKDWMICDYNDNGRIDGPYDSWVDKNRNNVQDPDEPVVGDFQLLKEMGCNVIRNYHHGGSKQILRELYEKYGIMSLMGDLIGMYSVGSGAGWAEGTDYSNPEHRKNMMESVKKLVADYKDEPFLLFWVLGNENNYGVANNSQKDPATYYKFVNDIARMIHEMDPDHPVALCNGDVHLLRYFAEHCPDVDIFSCNAYRGDKGFSSLWLDVKERCDKPVFISEYGTFAYKHNKSTEFGEKMQAAYHQGCWNDILFHTAGSGEGNSLGGVVFEWIDEWWKAGHPSKYPPDKQDIWSDADKAYDEPICLEEWLGICGQGDGKSSPFLRQLRPAYFMYKKVWNQ